MQKRFFSIVIFCLTNIILVAQSPFKKGFEVGFKKGYCFDKPIACILPPVAPTAPMPRINESDDDYNAGYNRGFQTGMDLQRLESTYGNNGNLQLKTFDYKGKEPYRSSDYVPPVNLKLLGNVLMYKQALYDSRKKWTQLKINDLEDFANSILLPLLVVEGNFEPLNSIIDHINNFVKSLNSQSLDLSDNYIFSQITSNIKIIEKNIYKTYDKYK